MNRESESESEVEKIVEIKKMKLMQNFLRETLIVRLPKVLFHL